MDKNHSINALASSTPYTSFFNEGDLKGQAQPPAFTPPVVKSELPLLFKICKYYLLVVNGLAFGLSALLVGLMALAVIVLLFTETLLAVGLVPVVGLVSLLPLYFWFVPIQGASKEMSTRLIVHGIICVLLLSGVFVGTPEFPKPTNAQEERNIAVWQAVTSPCVRLSRLVYGAIEVAVCFAMAHNIRQREMNNHFGMA